MRLLTLSLSLSAVLGGYTLISSDGTLKSKLATKYIEAKVGTSTAEKCPVVGVLELTGSNIGYESVNLLLQTEFKGTDVKNAVCLDITSSQAVMATSFDEMFSSTKYCGAKGTDLCATVAETLVVVFPSSDLDEYLLGHEQTMRRIVAKAKIEGVVKGILFVIDISEDQSSGGFEVSAIEKKFEELWNESGGDENNPNPCPTNVITLDKSNADSVKSAQGALATLSSSGVPEGASTLLKKIEDAWDKVGTGIVQPVLSSEESKSVYLIEQSYMLAQRECEAAFGQWYKRVNSGKIVGKFGERVLALLESAEGKFMSSTKASSMARLRGQRRRQIVDLIDSTANQVFKHQVVILQAEYTAKFRDLLASLVTSQSALTADDTSTDLVDKSEEQQAIRQVLFEFRSQVLDLEIERLGLTSEAVQAEFSQSLEAFAKEFPESAFGRLEAVKKMEKLAKKTPKKKGGIGLGKNRAVNIGLNLVGMLRPPGFGNLQGFVGYGTAIFGLPLELLFGVQNDGDSPEIMGEDREQPILRLQPKVHFDCDL